MKIKEFLVGVGFGVDKASEAKFNAAIEAATKNVANLGAEAIATAATVGLSVVTIARQFEDLYYVSQRTKVGVGALQSWESASKTIGITAEASRASIEGMAAAMRQNVGIAALARQFGVGPGGTPQDLARGLKARYGALGDAGYQIAANFAGMFNIEEQTFRQLWTNIEKVDAAKAKFDKRNKESGVDLDRLAERSRTFGNALDSLGEGLRRIGDQTADKWLPAMTSAVEALDKLAQGAVQANKDTGGYLSTVISLVTAYGTLKTLAPILRALGLGGLATGATGLATLSGVGAVGALGFMAASKYPLDWSAVTSAKTGKFGVSMGPQAHGTAAERRKEAIEYFKSQGWDEKTAIGMTMSLTGESATLDPRAYNPAGGGMGAHGIGQWRGKRLEDFKRVMGKSIGDSTFQEQLAFHQWELQNTEKSAGDAIRGSKTAGEAAAAHSRLFERHGDPSEDARRALRAQSYFDASLAPAPGGTGPAPVTITQKTDIHVNGADSPGQTGREVASQQSRVNGDIVRNFEGAVR